MRVTNGFRAGLALVALVSLSARTLPATEEVQEEGSGEGYNPECGINRNATDGYGNRYHASAYQPLAQGYTDQGTVAAVQYHTSTGIWYWYSQEVAIHQQ